MTVVYARISDAPLSVDAHVTAVSRATDGAVTTFLGQVRNHDPSVRGEVTHLDYSAHPDAQATLESIVRRVAGASSDPVSVAVTHRVGMLAVGDAAIVVAVAGSHRAETFTVCHEVVERVKAEVPIWKREILRDGSHTWVGIS